MAWQVLIYCNGLTICCAACTAYSPTSPQYSPTSPGRASFMRPASAERGANMLQVQMCGSGLTLCCAARSLLADESSIQPDKSRQSSFHAPFLC